MGLEVERKGPAARARAEGRGFNIQLLKNAYTPFTDDEGRPTSRIQPYLPILDACQLCPARCCRLNVKISLPDALRYCSTLGLPFFAGLTLVPSTHGTHAFEVARDSRVVADEDPWIGKAEIQLRRREDGGCHALVSIGGYERCGIYDARPSMCRLYPVAWEADVAKGGPEMVLCAVPYAIPPGAAERFKEAVESSIENWELHDDIVEAWHTRTSPADRTIRAFLEFALPRTAHALKLPLGPALALGLPEQRLLRAMKTSKVLPEKTPDVTLPADALPGLPNAGRGRRR